VVPRDVGKFGKVPYLETRHGGALVGMGDSGSDPFCPHSPDGRLGKVRKSDIGGRLHGAKGINRANLLHPGGLRVVQRYTQALRHRLVMVVSGPADLLKTQGIEPPVPLRRPQGARQR